MNIVLVNYILKAAIRDRLLLSLILVMILSSVVSIFFGSSSIIEHEYVVSVYLAGSLRVVSVIGLVLFVCFYIRRLFETREIEFILSKPVSRVSFIISHSAAFTILSFIIFLTVSLILFAFDYKNFNYDYAFWCLSLFVELVIISNSALFFSMVLGSASSSAMATIGFYALSRMIGLLLAIVYSNAALGFFGIEILGFVMQVVSLIVPRLDLLAQTTWLIYGVPENINMFFVVGHGILFTMLVILAALVDLVRRKF